MVEYRHGFPVGPPEAQALAHTCLSLALSYNFDYKAASESFLMHRHINPMARHLALQTGLT